MEEQKPGLGRIVHYRLSADDAKQINRRRTDGASIAARMKNAIPPDEGRNTDPIYGWPAGAQAHIGNEVKEGDTFPMLPPPGGPDRGGNIRTSPHHAPVGRLAYERRERAGLSRRD